MDFKKKKEESAVKQKQEEEIMETEIEIIDAPIEEDDLTKQLEVKDALIKEYLDKYQRTMADFDNFRKRTIKEKASMYDDGVKDTVEKFLPVIDNFERALASSQNKDDSFYKGVEMILRQLTGLLDYIGVEPIAAVGEKFDPNIHNAVAHVQDEAYSENEIIDELQKGYMYKDKVVRVSMVRVAN